MDKEEVNVILGIVILIAVIWVFFLNGDSSEIINFEECIAAGNPAMESYPRQCRDPVSDRTFVEEIEDWKLDGINLMQHESEGYYGCFGCSEAGAEPALCVDPIMEMKLVEETSERYCGSDFEVVEICSEESRGADVCVLIHQPVCADVRVECVTTPCDPVKETYSNSCFACQNDRVDSYVVGEC